MKTKVQTWGDSVMLRVPKAFAVEMGLEPDTIVDLHLADGKLMVTPVAEDITLERLLNGVTDGNLHGEVDMGHPTKDELF